MAERLDLPALGGFLRDSAQRSTDSTASHRPNANQRLDASRWLELLAAVLGCSPSWLLATGRVDDHDLAERGRISAAAQLIRSHGWEKPPAHSYAPPAATPQHGKPLVPSGVWVAARDAYLGHFLACSACRARRRTNPVRCLVGDELRLHYEHESF